MSNTLFGSNPANACSLYAAVRSGTRPDQRTARKNCEDLWRTYSPYADEHFLSEFPLRFHQRWFEMWLTVFLLRTGHKVECPKPGSDIRIVLDGQVVWIEAVCATAGQEGKRDSVPRPVHGQVSDTPMNAYTLRATNALNEKAKAFERYITQGIVRSYIVTLSSRLFLRGSGVRNDGIPWNRSDGPGCRGFACQVSDGAQDCPSHSGACSGASQKAA